MRIPIRSRTLARCAPYLLLGLVAAQAPARDEPTLSLAGLTLEDQHGNSHALSADTRTVVFTSGMDASKIVRKLLEDRPAGWLARHQAVFVADIHKMPRLITRFIALPRMRRYDYPMLLIRDDETAAAWPREEDRVTVLELGDLKVKKVSYTSDVGELETWIVGADAELEVGGAAGEEPTAP